MSEMTLTFPGGLAVHAHYHGHEIATDQPERAGGADSAPSPFDLFLASIATCVGYFAVRFCRQRDIDTTGLEVRMTQRRDEAAHRVAELAIEVRTPPGFPEKYVAALHRAVDQCSVKRHILEPPEMRVEIVAAAAG